MSKDSTSMAIKTSVYVHIVTIKADKLRAGNKVSYSRIIQDALNGYYGVLDNE